MNRATTGNSTAASQTHRPRIAAVMLAVCAAAVIPWVGTVTYPLLHDDNMAVVNNPLVDGR
ncbi:MAG TPA: hypothetical protein PKG82_12905, partial [Myxococcota bacterium]|nr:hypothetical protein [Myxococcota bacterium]